MNRCKTCKWRVPHQDSFKFRCDYADETQSVPIPQQFELEVGSEAYCRSLDYYRVDAWLLVGPDFGCVNHSANEIGK